MPGLGGRGLVSHLVGRAVLEAAAGALAQRSIRLMPLKGIWLQERVYAADPAERPITDVDVLVPEGDYARAIELLCAAGFRLLSSDVWQAALLAPGLPLPLDLHKRVFARAAFRMPTAELFARGTRDRRRFGVELVLPDPLDVFAHLVGHFVKSRGGRDSAPFRLRDFARLAEGARLDPERTARHLMHCRLARASRYVLSCVPDALDPSGFCAATLARLPRDPAGEVCASTMLRLRDRVGPRARLAALPGFVLEPSLGAAVVSLVMRAWDNVR
ncbi:MAG TPA: nucleotidyltransferase family protein [Polyangiales bacterium]|nr:nucleotidyltransferase family protein [Polyangiales bacterium]